MCSIGATTEFQLRKRLTVAEELAPISNLKVFQTHLNGLCGGLVNPPVAGVHNRAVPDESLSPDKGYVITIIPKKRDTLVQASSKKNKGFYIRSGSGFYLLPEVLIGEFYRRRHSPILSLSLKLNEARLDEKLIEAEHRDTAIPSDVYWGRCTYSQSIAIDWTANLRNDGLGSANQVVVDLRVPPSNSWEIVSFGVEKDYYSGPEWTKIPSYSPVQTEHFKKTKTNVAAGKLLDPIHPGQEKTIANGTLHIPLDEFEGNVVEFAVSGFAYAADSSPFPLLCHMTGAELKTWYEQAYLTIRDHAEPATRVIPKRPRFRDFE